MTTYFIISSAKKFQSEVISLDEVRLLNEQRVAFQMKNKNRNSDHSGILTNGVNKRKEVIGEPMNCNGMAGKHDREAERSRPSSGELERNNACESNINSECESVSSTSQLTESPRRQSNGTVSLTSEQSVTDSNISDTNVTDSPKSSCSVTKAHGMAQLQVIAPEAQKLNTGSSESQVNVTENKTVTQNSTSKKNVTGECEGDLIVTGSQKKEKVTSIGVNNQSNQSKDSQQSATEKRDSLGEQSATDSKSGSPKHYEKRASSKCDKNGIIISKEIDAKGTQRFKTKIVCNGTGNVDKSNYDEFNEQSDDHEHVTVGGHDVVMRKSLKLKNNIIDQRL